MRSRGAVPIEADDEAIESRPMLSVSAITTRRVAEYRVARLAGKSKRGTLRSPATVNRECALLRRSLRMALAWEELAKLPTFKMAKEEGRQRFLTTRMAVAPLR